MASLDDSTCILAPLQGDHCGPGKITLLFHRWTNMFKHDSSSKFNVSSCEEGTGTAKIDLEFSGTFVRSKKQLVRAKARHFIEWDQTTSKIISISMMSLQPSKLWHAYMTGSQERWWKMKQAWRSSSSPMKFIAENVTIRIPNMFQSGLNNETVFTGKSDAFKLYLAMKRLFSWKRPSEYKRIYKVLAATDTNLLFEARIDGLQWRKTHTELGPRIFYKNMTWNKEGLLSDVELLINKPLPA